MARRLAALALIAGGLLLAGQMTMALAGGRFSIWAFLGGMVLAGVSLPVVAHTREARWGRLVTAGSLVVVVGLALTLLFNMQLILVLADFLGVLVWDSTMETGRKAVLLVVGVGLLILAAAWDRDSDDVPVRLALLLVGGAGIALTFMVEGRLHVVWYLALGALWVYVGLAALLDARRLAG